MLQTLEAEIDVNGNMHLREPVRITKPTRALVTLLEEAPAISSGQGNVAEVLRLLGSPEFANRKSYPAAEIVAQIEENRRASETTEPDQSESC